jgi:hypothetical protein
MQVDQALPDAFGHRCHGWSPVRVVASLRPTAS